MNLAKQAVQHQGGEPDAANHIYRWVSEHPAFEEVVYRQWWFQVSDWNSGRDADSRRKNRHGLAMRDDILVRQFFCLALTCVLTMWVTGIHEVCKTTHSRRRHS